MKGTQSQVTFDLFSCLQLTKIVASSRYGFASRPKSKNKVRLRIRQYSPGFSGDVGDHLVEIHSSISRLATHFFDVDADDVILWQ